MGPVEHDRLRLNSESPSRGWLGEGLGTAGVRLKAAARLAAGVARHRGRDAGSTALVLTGPGPFMVAPMGVVLTGDLTAGKQAALPLQRFLAASWLQIGMDQFSSSPMRSCRLLAKRNDDPCA